MTRGAVGTLRTKVSSGRKTWRKLLLLSGAHFPYL
jgi:hypothetical protein